MNPDGVDNGHWRHNANGVDLNRDWTGFNQPETSNIKNFLKKKTKEGYDFTLGVDFHSTWQDVYIPTIPQLQVEAGVSSMNGYVQLTEIFPTTIQI